MHRIEIDWGTGPQVCLIPDLGAFLNQIDDAIEKAAQNNLPGKVSNLQQIRAAVQAEFTKTLE
jgi:hypothetical protein